MTHRIIQHVFEIKGQGYLAEDDGEFIHLLKCGPDLPLPVSIGYMDWLTPGCGLGKIRASVKRGYEAERARHWNHDVEIGEARRQHAHNWIAARPGVQVFAANRVDVLNISDLAYDDQIAAAVAVLFWGIDIPIVEGSRYNSSIEALSLGR